MWLAYSASLLNLTGQNSGDDGRLGIKRIQADAHRQPWMSFAAEFVCRGTIEEVDLVTAMSDAAVRIVVIRDRDDVNGVPPRLIYSVNDGVSDRPPRTTSVAPEIHRRLE
jgi:hypothetical protein